MIYRLEIMLRRIRFWISRSEWLIRLLHLKKTDDPASNPGLVMIQIDGLSHTQLKRALDNGKMPFLDTLLKSEKYHLLTLYSGLPSSTPGVQGELLYGVKTAVPAFSYKEHCTGRIIRFFEPDAAAGVEHILENRGSPLLKGGSAYSDIYTGGASESHFCTSSIGWGKVLQAANPFVLIVFILSHFYSFVRAAILLVIEFILAMVDCVSGLIAGQDLLKELKFVPTRVGITILLRELVTIGAKMDVARGLPVVHLNLLGYDEQAHRRGPSSLFAHWTLKGIDSAIARIWKAAKRSTHRDYDVWIYSDHGQEDTLAYPEQHGRTIGEAVADVFERLEGQKANVAGNGNGGVQYKRARHLGGKKIQRFFQFNGESHADKESNQLAVTAMGPLGFVYSPEGYGWSQLNQLARELVDSAKVPMVLAKNGLVMLRVWTEDGEFVLPEHKKKIFGDNHPFLDEVTRDLIELCHHPDAGDLVLCGWRYGKKPISFPMENGAHAGPGPEETKAFALLPDDISFPSDGRDFLRPLDLHHAAFNTLDSRKIRCPDRADRNTSESRSLRIMTYNIHSGIGMDGKISPERIARVIAQYDPDIVALQEVDVCRSRSNCVDQARVIAKFLSMDVHFSPTIHVEKGQYGNAIFTHFPMRMVRAEKLPGLPEKKNLEHRGAIWVTIDVDGNKLQFFNTHLGLRKKERQVQAKALLDQHWLSHPDCQGYVVVCGDFNSLPFSKVWRCFRQRLNDAQIALNSHRPKKTLLGRFPLARIDHIFVEHGIEVTGIDVPNTELTRVASDHLPLIVDLHIPNS